MTFRFDDVCINADMDLIHRMVDYLSDKHQPVRILYGVSPLVHHMDTSDKVDDQRIFPEILNAMSDYRNFYKVERAGIPDLPRGYKAGHGLVHVDHRLLTKEVQELSIIASCSLVGAKTFIPPFNKWNKDTEAICEEQGIELIKFEDGWRSMEHNSFDSAHALWYLHAREWTFKKFVAWFTV